MHYNRVTCYITWQGGRSRSFKELRQAAGTVSLTNDLVNSLDGVNHHLFNASSHLFTGKHCSYLDIINMPHLTSLLVSIVVISTL